MKVRTNVKAGNLGGHLDGAGSEEPCLPGHPCGRPPLSVDFLRGWE
jgi:hypothetical protein